MLELLNKSRIRLAIALALLTAASAFGETLMSSKDALKQLLSGSAKMSKLAVTPSADEAKHLKEKWDVTDGETTFYLGKDATGATAKAAVLITEAGKEGPITAAVGLDAAGKITEVLLLEFSEDHGKAAKEKAFLGQFKGKDSAAKFKPGTDVDGIAGATWTSTSISTIARRATALFQVLVLDRKKP